MRTPWRAVAASFALNGSLLGVWASRIPAIAETHALSHGALGALLLVLAGGAILAFPVTGWAVDRFGAYGTTHAITLAYLVALCLIAGAPGVAGLAVALFLFGAAHGAMDVAMNAWGAEVERAMARPVMSSFHAMFSLGAGLGAASGFLAVSAGLSVPVHFVLASLLFGCAGLAWSSIGWQSPRTEASARGSAVFAWPRGALLAVGVLAFCTSLGEGAIVDWSAVFLIEIQGVGAAEAALGYAAFSVSMVCMRLAGDRIIARLGAVTAARLSGAVALVGVLTVISASGLALALLGFALMGIGYAMVMPLAFSRAANDPGQSAGAAIAQVATLGYGGLLLGPPVIGALAELTSLQAAFGLLALLAAVILFGARALSAPAANQMAE